MAADAPFKKDLGEGGFEALEAKQAKSGKESFAAKFGQKKIEAEAAATALKDESKGFFQRFADRFRGKSKAQAEVTANLKRVDEEVAEFEEVGEALLKDLTDLSDAEVSENLRKAELILAELEKSEAASAADQSDAKAATAMSVPVTTSPDSAKAVQAKVEQAATDAELRERLKKQPSGKMLDKFFEYRDHIGQTDAYGKISEVRLPETQRGELFIGYDDGSSIRRFPTGLALLVKPDGTIETLEDPDEKRWVPKTAAARTPDAAAAKPPDVVKTPDKTGTAEEVTAAIAELEAAKKPSELRSFLSKGNYVSAAELALQSDADLEDLRPELEGKLREMETERREPYLQKARHQAELYLQHFDPNFTVGITNVEVKPDDPAKKPYSTRCLRISNLADAGMNWTMDIQPTDEYLKDELEPALKKRYEDGIERSAAAEAAKEEVVVMTSDMKKKPIDSKGITQRAETQLVELRTARDTDGLKFFLEKNGFATAEALAKMTRSDLEKARAEAYESITAQGSIPVQPYDLMFPPLVEKKPAPPAGSDDIEAGSRRVVMGDTARAELLRKASADADIAKAKTLPSGGQEPEKATSSKKEQAGNPYDRMTLTSLEEQLELRKQDPKQDSGALVLMEESILRRNSPEGLEKEVANAEVLITRAEERLASLSTPEGTEEMFDLFAQEESVARGSDAEDLRKAWKEGDFEVVMDFGVYKERAKKDARELVALRKKLKETLEGRLLSQSSQPKAETKKDSDILDPKEHPLDPAALPAIVEALKGAGKNKDGKFATAASFKEALEAQGFKLPLDLESDSLIDLHKAYKALAHGKPGKKKKS